MQDSLEELKAYKGCIVLCRYMVGIDDKDPGCAAHPVRIIGVRKKPRSINVQYDSSCSSWISLVDGKTPEECKKRRISVGLLDVTDHRGEVIYRNPALETLWSQHSKHSEINIRELQLYGKRVFL